jgi:hypothetical protein
LPFAGDEEEAVRQLPFRWVRQLTPEQRAALDGQEQKAAAYSTAGEVKLKRSTTRGEARAKIIAALTKHHQYADGGCLSSDPIGVSALARMADVRKSSVSEFFQKAFDGHAAYKVLCRDVGRLVDSIKSLRGEFSPRDLKLYGRRPVGEDDRDGDE